MSAIFVQHRSMQTLAANYRDTMEAAAPATRAGRKPLAGIRILVVEDNWLVAEEIADALESAGARILGPFPNMIDALENLTDLQAIDGAVLDIGLGDEVSYPLAEALRITRVPFLFLTGVERSKLPQQFSRTAHMLKPCTPAQLVQRLLDIGVCDH